MPAGKTVSPEVCAKISAAARGRPSSQRGKHLSFETRAKLSEANRGERHPNWGKHLSPEHRAKIGAAQRGKYIPLETRAKMSLARRGKPGSMCGKNHSVDSRRKMSEAKRGARHPNFGKTFSAEYRATLTEAQRTRWRSQEQRQKSSEIQRRVWLNPELRAKSSLSQLRVMREHPELRRIRSENAQRHWDDPTYKDRVVRATRKAARIRPTLPERRVGDLLNAHFPDEWKYTGNGEVIIGGKNPDFTNVNGRKAVIEVFGDYWHGEKRTGVPVEQHVADRITHFAQYGFDCLVIWEHEMRDESAVLKKVEAFNGA
jgi:G:T-mismatch repair DNA endonuclease (very short patch repair protein)